MPDPLVIRQSACWLWKVRTNQAHLGHKLFIAARETSSSLADCTPAEWADLREQIALYERVMARLFAPDRFNYTQFGNEWPQLHVHAFPRYRNAAEWRGCNYPDPQWGKAPIPEPPSPLEGDALHDFAAWFGTELS